MNSDQIYLLIGECIAAGEGGVVTVPVERLLLLINSALDVDTLRHHPSRNAVLVTLLRERLSDLREEFPGEASSKRDAYDHAMRLLSGDTEIEIVKQRTKPKLRVIGGGRG